MIHQLCSHVKPIGCDSSKEASHELFCTDDQNVVLFICFSSRSFIQQMLTFENAKNCIIFSVEPHAIRPLVALDVRISPVNA